MFRKLVTWCNQNRRLQIYDIWILLWKRKNLLKIWKMSSKNRDWVYLFVWHAVVYTLVRSQASQLWRWIFTRIFLTCRPMSPDPIFIWVSGSHILLKINKIYPIRLEDSMIKKLSERSRCTFRGPTVLMERQWSSIIAKVYSWNCFLHPLGNQTLKSRVRVHQIHLDRQWAYHLY